MGERTEPNISQGAYSMIKVWYSTVLKPLCFMGNLVIDTFFSVEGSFSARFQDVEA